MPSTISAGTTAGTAIAIAGDTTGNLAFQTNGTTTAMTINTSQQVGIGTTSPTAPLDIQADSGSGAINIRGRVSGDIGSLNFYNNANTTQQFFIQSRAAYTQLNTVANIDMLFATNNTEQMRLTAAGLLQFNSGYGSVATAYGCRAWVNFDGSTSPGTIRGSGNVSSVSRTGTGQYTVNFTTSMPDANYSVVGIANADSRTVSIGNLLAGSAAIRTTNTAGALENQTLVAIAVFR